MDEINNTQPTPSAPIQTPVPVSPLSQNWRKIIFSVLGILLALGSFSYLGYQYVLQKQSPPVAYPTGSPTPLPTTDLTTNWKTYESEILGISIKYPDSWEVKLSGSTLNIGPKGEIFRIVGYKLTEGDLSTINDTYVTDKSQTVTKRNMTISSYLVTEYTIKFSKEIPKGGTTVVDIIKFDNRQFLLQLVDYQSKGVFDQILSTFKFLSSSSQPSPTECLPPPNCSGQIIYGDPNPNDPNQCPRYRCSQ